MFKNSISKKNKRTIISIIFVSVFAILTSTIDAYAVSPTIDKAHYSVQIGSTIKIGAKGSNLAWSTSNKNIATVNEKGEVKGISMGIATITAKSGGRSASCEITCGFYRGIDVSCWNVPIDWAKAKNQQGIDFAIIRAGFGWEDYPHQNDKQFVANVEGCVKNNIPFGIYFYSYAKDNSNAIKEANYLIRELNEFIPKHKHKMAIPIAYDLEESWVYTMDKKKLTDMALAFCNTLKKAGYKTMVYGNTATFNNMDLNRIKSNGVDFWYALYQNTPIFSRPETIGKSSVIPCIWQYASDGTVPGVGEKNKVDMNILYMPRARKGGFKCTSTRANVTTQGSGNATIRWDSVAEAEYTLYRAELSPSGSIDKSKVVRLYKGSSTSFTDNTMQYGKGYYYYTDASFYAGDMLNPSYRENFSGINTGAYVYNVLNGDVDGDGKITLADAMTVQKIALGKIKPNNFQKFAADYNKSGSVEMADANAVLKCALENKK